jgi:hypothetical protein
VRCKRSLRRSTAYNALLLAGQLLIMRFYLRVSFSCADFAESSRSG